MNYIFIKINNYRKPHNNAPHHFNARKIFFGWALIGNLFYFEIHKNFMKYCNSLSR